MTNLSPASNFRCPEIHQAWTEAKKLNVIGKPYQAFRAHYHRAKERGIPFLFTFSEWWTWWQVDGRWHQRGMGTDKLVMARHGDVGPYSLDNVYCCTHAKNHRDIDWTTASKKHKTNWSRKSAEEKATHHLAVRGDGHPKSRAVITPAGRFGSIALAAEHYGLTRAGGYLRAKDNREGWHFEAKP